MISSCVIVSGCSVAVWSMNGRGSFSIAAFNDLPGCTVGGNMGRNGLITNVLLDYGYWVNMREKTTSMACNDTNFIDQANSQFSNTLFYVWLSLKLC